MNKNFFINLFKEGIGYESGLIRTIVDLYKNPKRVVEASVNNDLTYLNPVKFMMTICSYFVVVNSFFIDWEAVSLKHFKEINYLISGTKATDAIGSKIELFQSRFIDFLFSAGLIPMLILISILQLYFISRKMKAYNYSFDYLKDVLFYYNGLNVLLYFVFSLAAAILNTKLFLIFYSVFFFLIIIGYRKVVELKPVEAYFDENSTELAKLFKRSMIRATFIFTFVSMILGVLIGLLIEYFFPGSLF
jgi:hypothetical protein